VNGLKDENAALRMDLEAGNGKNEKEAVLMSQIDQLKHDLEEKNVALDCTLIELRKLRKLKKCLTVLVVMCVIAALLVVFMSV
jgi:t-SNARE complex subunit (syntaxin)